MFRKLLEKCNNKISCTVRQFIYKTINLLIKLVYALLFDVIFPIQRTKIYQFHRGSKHALFLDLILRMPFLRSLITYFTALEYTPLSLRSGEILLKLETCQVLEVFVAICSAKVSRQVEWPLPRSKSTFTPSLNFSFGSGTLWSVSKDNCRDTFASTARILKI